MKSLIRKRREQRALCPKCLSPDYHGLAPDNRHPDKKYVYGCEYIFGAGNEPYWWFLSQRHKINIEPKPIWECRSCGHIFQTEKESVHFKLSHFNELIERSHAL